MREVRNFGEGLGELDTLIELIESPFLALLKETLPAYSDRTKPSLAEPAALMVVGAASVVCGGDRAADKALKSFWDKLLPHFAAMGMRVPAKALCTQNFRDYRDGFLGGDLPDEFKDLARTLFAGLAKELGLFADVPTPVGSPSPTQTVYADGTYFAAASQVRDVTTSKSKLGQPRVVTDADRWSNGCGYTFCLLMARTPERHSRVVLDIVRAPDMKEMDVVVPAAKDLQLRLGPGFRCFVYDGAMHGMHHLALRSAGLLTVNKPKGIQTPRQAHRHRDEEMGMDAKLFELVTGCPHGQHLATAVAGMVWEVEEHLDGFRRRRVLDNVGVRRSDDGTGRFSWEVDLVVPCRGGDHTVTVDPNATYKATTVSTFVRSMSRSTAGGATMNLSEALRIVQINDESFGALYGLRNDAESANSHIKNKYRFGSRARSYTAGRVCTDLWLYALMANTLTWREHLTATGRAGRARR